MKTKTKIEKQLRNKNNPQLVETIILCKKNEKWLDIAKAISSSRKKRTNINLLEVNQKTKDNEKILIPGKVLSEGEVSKKIDIVALEFSEKAKEKLSKNKIKFSYIIDEIKKNPKFEGIKVLKK